MKNRKGIPVSPGVAVGVAYCIDDIFVSTGGESLAQEEVSAELERFEEACEKSITELKALFRKVQTQVGEHEAQIFKAHEYILTDPSFKSKVRKWIAEQQQTAPAALHHVMNEYTSLFARTKDDYLKERLADLRDVIVRLSSHLSEVLKPESQALPGPVIIVANEILPSQALALGDREVVGFVTQTGGQTSHAAILARSRGVPAISGIPGILRQVKNGDTVIIDGRDGHVFLEPDAETESAYRKIQREFVDLKDTLADCRDQPAVTADGEPLQLLANINSVSDAKAAVAMGADGIGLFRTEYLYLTHPTVPDEEEQLEAYADIIEHGPDGPITIRTLDIGGDKTIAYLGHAREANPFMGWRSIRLSFEHPEFFLTQIRAILHSSSCIKNGSAKQVQILFPMITTLEELRKIRSMVRKARRLLEKEGHEVGDVPIGLMVEVPAAAISIRTLIQEVDFVSIGSNDLVQYLMAADRDNPKVAHLCQPLSPPVLVVLNDVIHACNERKIPITVCGEMAGSPKSFLLLYAMGLRRFSMSPSFIPSMKELASHLTQERCEQILKRVLKLKTTGQVQRYMREQIEDVCPNMKLFDSK